MAARARGVWAAPPTFRKSSEDNCSPKFGGHRSRQDIASSFRAVGRQGRRRLPSRRFHSFNRKLHRER
eukprot:6776278-Prymnesium_polylepis.1